MRRIASAIKNSYKRQTVSNASAATIDSKRTVALNEERSLSTRNTSVNCCCQSVTVVCDGNFSVTGAERVFDFWQQQSAPRHLTKVERSFEVTLKLKSFCSICCHGWHAVDNHGLSYAKVPSLLAMCVGRHREWRNKKNTYHNQPKQPARI